MKLEVRPIIPAVLDGGGATPVLSIDIPDEGHFLRIAEVILTKDDGTTETKNLYVARQDRHNKIHLAAVS